MKHFFVLFIFSSFLFGYEVEFVEPKILKETFEIPIKIKADEPFLALQFLLKYEKGLKYEGFRWGEVVEGTLNALNDKKEGEIRGAVASATELPKEGIVCYIKFRGKGKIKLEEFLVNDIPAKIKNNDFEIKKK